ncbi:MAG: hypothetical protein LIV24_01560 [Eubacterium sp.]|nr:hypothetical protein [Eubacterium sp.]
MIAAVATLTQEELAESEPINLRHGSVTGPDGVHGIGEVLYQPDTLKWLTIGMVYDHPKTWTFMGGGVAPGEGALIQYVLQTRGKEYFPDEFSADRRENISWYYRDGYLPCPVSIWRAHGFRITIQHFARRNDEDSATLVFSKVQVDNEFAARQNGTLLINASPEVHVPLGQWPDHENDLGMAYNFSLEPGCWKIFEFVSTACGEPVQSVLREQYGSFEENYQKITTYYDQVTAHLTHPIQLPDEGITNMFRSAQIALRNAVVQEGAEVQMRSGSNNPARIQSYDREFPHDVPNMLDELMREGDYYLAKQVLTSENYQKMNTADTGDWDGLNYMDTIGKFLLPYAQYLQNTGDTTWFDDARFSFLRKAAHNIHAFRVTDGPHPGLMKKGEDFENWSDDGDYLLADNWCALHGLAAYAYICRRIGQTGELKWAEAEMDSLNDDLNRALDEQMKRNNLNYYRGAMDDSSYQRYVAGSFYSWVPYSAALSTFPWGAYLHGFKNGGTWKEYFDASLDAALRQRDIRQIPQGSWGAWWGKNTYGSVYNAAAGLQCLASDGHRQETFRNVEFLYHHQCAPFMWSEAFESKGRDAWDGMYLPQESYGNYELWGVSFLKQAILQACVSVAVDGTVIIGRGIPDHWMHEDAVVSWKHVNVNDNRYLDFSLQYKGGKLIFSCTGDEPEGSIILDLPWFQTHLPESQDGVVSEDRKVILSPDTRKAVLTF